MIFVLLTAAGMPVALYLKYSRIGGVEFQEFEENLETHHNP